MSVIKWIQVVLILLRVDNSLQDSVIYTRSGVTVNLPCDPLPGEPGCLSTTWLHLKPGSGIVSVFEHGVIIMKGLHTSQRADRLVLESDCSLTVKDVTADDSGLYLCQKIQNGRLLQHLNQRSDLFVLDVTTVNGGTQQKCHLHGYGNTCTGLTVRWMKDSTTLVEHTEDTVCSSTVTIDNYDQTKMVTCQVTKANGELIDFVKTPTQPTGPPTTTSTGPPPPPATTSSSPSSSPSSPSSSSLQPACSEGLYVGVTVVRVVGTVAIFLMLLAVVLAGRRAATETPTMDPYAVIDG